MRTCWSWPLVALPFVELLVEGESAWCACWRWASAKANAQSILRCVHFWLACACWLGGALLVLVLAWVLLLTCARCLLVGLSALEAVARWPAEWSSLALVRELRFAVR